MALHAENALVLSYRPVAFPCYTHVRIPPRSNGSSGGAISKTADMPRKGKYPVQSQQAPASSLRVTIRLHL
jgi:hypothetical protein